MLTSERTSRSWVSRQVTEPEPRGARTRGGLVSPGRTGCCLPTGRVVTSLPTDAKAPSRRRPRPPAPARTPSWDALGGAGETGATASPCAPGHGSAPSAPPPLSSSSRGPRLAAARGCGRLPGQRRLGPGPWGSRSGPGAGAGGGGAALTPPRRPSLPCRPQPGLTSHLAPHPPRARKTGLV